MDLNQGVFLQPETPQDPASAQNAVALGPQVSSTTSELTSISDIIESYELSKIGWNWTFPAPFQLASTMPAIASSLQPQTNMLLSQVPSVQDTSSVDESQLPEDPIDSDSGDELAPAVISRLLLPPRPALTPEEMERIEIERLNEEGLQSGSDGYFNSSEIYSRASSNEDDEEDDSKPSTPNSALPTTDGGKYVSSWLSSGLNLYERRVLVGADNLNFREDPMKDTVGTGASVLSIFYPKNSYSPSHSDPVGGVSFYAQPFSISPQSDAVNSSDTSSNPPRVLLPALNALPSGALSLLTLTSNTSSDFSTSKPSLLLSYSVYFPADFDFVKGGKLPGLYSSTGFMNSSTGTIDANTDSCSGGAGNEAGKSCWSIRLMWRENGEGELYLYLPIQKSGEYDPCGITEAGNNGKSRENWICNSDYGVSLGRGKFQFTKGR